MQHRSSYRLALLIAIAIHIALALVIYIIMNPYYQKKPAINDANRFEVSFHTLSSAIEAEPSVKPIPQLPPPAATQRQTVSTTNKESTSPIRQESKTFVTAQNVPSISTKELLDQPENIRLREAIKRHYGDDFFKLTPKQQHYIITNLQKIRRINDIVGNRLLQTKPQENLENRDNNYVEFYLHPDGSISDLTLQNERTDSLLDELTYETIHLAHTQYPKPEETTLIRIRVWIIQK